MKLKDITNDYNFILIVFYGFLSHLYYTVRYSGRIAHGDTAVITKTIQSMDAGSIFAYRNGYGFQVVSDILSQVTNLTIQQILIVPIGFIYIIVAYPLFLDLIKEKKTAILSLFLLTLQPYLLFSTSRGSHERFTVYLFLMSILILVMYFKHNKTSLDKLKYLFMLSISIFGIYATNIYFAALLNVILISSIFLYIAYSRKIKNGLVHFTPIFTTLVITFIFYSFTAANFGIFRRMQIIITKMLDIINLSNILLEFAILSLVLVLILNKRSIHLFTKLMKPVTVIIKRRQKEINFILICASFCIYLWGLNKLSHAFELSFKSPTLWLVLTSFNWIVLPLSAFGFLKILSILNKPHDFFHVFENRLFLLCLYISSFFALFAAVASDFVGTGIGDNFKMRVFPYLLLFVVPIASIMIADIYTRLRNQKYKKVWKTGFIILIITLVIISGLRSTLDPIVSDHKIFYSIEEEYGLKWMEANIEGPFTIYDGRIYAAYNYISEIYSPKAYSKKENLPKGKFDYNFISEYTTPVSKITKDHAINDNQNIIYTNNNVQLYSTHN